MSTATARASALWAPDRRAVTVALVLLITLIAFEALSLGTVLPTLVTELRGEAWYSWPFTVFLAASVVGTVLSGRSCDRWGPVPPLAGGPALFLAGLVVAGTAGTMQVLLLGRLLQGLGGGVMIVALYVMIAVIYPEEDRSAAFGALAAAWVLPALLGPTAAGLLTQHLSWRAAFLGLAPLVMAGMVLLVPALRRIGLRPAADPSPSRPGLPVAALGAALGISAITWAAQHPSTTSLLLAVASLVLLAPALRRLLPAGTLTARPGLPVTILARGLLAGTFVAVEAYVPLTLTSVHGFSPALAGAPLTFGALGWSLAANWRGRHAMDPPALIRRGFLVLSVALAGTVLIAPDWGWAWAALPLWGLAGAGMGLAMPAVSVRTLALSPPAERGFNSAALQVCDMLSGTFLVGVGGVLIAALASTTHPTAAVVPLDLLMAGVAVLGAVLIGRR
ncbi:MFS transporter [Longimycelium tulufanense]|uniref:MFS transporter n=1 Tax=Longimycelium tulufanense TaxID=907463 RepID=UPI00166D7F16|nr:MFS transporter [Longimycelium tulufanense]